MNNTPRRTKSEEKRQQIIHAAGELFLSAGFEGVSMDKVALEAGVSKQTVYSHFGNKEDLFCAIINHKCTMHDLTDRFFDTNRPVHDVLRELAEHFTSLLMSKDAISVFRVCIADASNRAHVAELFWKAGPQQLNRLFANYLTEQNRLGKLHIDNPHFAAQQFLYMIKAEAYLLRALGQPDDHNLEQLPAYLDSCVAMFEKDYLD